MPSQVLAPYLSWQSRASGPGPCWQPKGGMNNIERLAPEPQPPFWVLSWGRGWLKQREAALGSLRSRAAQRSVEAKVCLYCWVPRKATLLQFRS